MFTLVDNPQQKNTFTFKKLRWVTGNIYGTGTDDLYLLKPDWLKRWPIETFLNIDGATCFQVPSGRILLIILPMEITTGFGLLVHQAEPSWPGKNPALK